MPQQLPGSRAPGFRDRSWPQRRAPPPRARSRPLLPPPTCDRPKGGDSGTAHRRGHLELPLPAPSTRRPRGDTRAAAPRPASAPRPPGGSRESKGCDALWGGGRGRAPRGGAARGRGSAGRRAVPPSGGGAMVQAGQGGVGSGFEPANFSSGQGRAPGRRRGRVSAAGWGGGQAPGPLGTGPPVWPLRPREGSPPARARQGARGTSDPAGAEGTELGLGAGVLEAGEPSRAAEIDRGGLARGSGERVCEPQRPLPRAPRLLPSQPRGFQVQQVPSSPVLGIFSPLFSGRIPRTRTVTPGTRRPPRQLPILGRSEALTPPPSAQGGAPGRGGAAFPWQNGQTFPAACLPRGGGVAGLPRTHHPRGVRWEKAPPRPRPAVHPGLMPLSFLVSTRAR